MIERGGFYWIPTLPGDMRERLENLKDNREVWPADFKTDYDRLRSDFTRSKAEFISWMRKDRDSRMNRTGKLVLAFVIDCLNFETGRCDPGQQFIGDELGIGLSTVERAIKRIADADWMEVTRRGKTTTNFYRFRVPVSKVNALLDLTTDLRERRIEARALRLQLSDPSKVRDHQTPDPARMTAHDPSEMTAHDPSEMTGKHMNRTPEGEHLNKISLSEVREDTYPRESIPTEECDFGLWIRLNIPDPTKHRDALRLLRERKMTPEALRRMAA
jgi:hypothetical protein